MKRIMLTLVLILGSLVVTAAPAAADCVSHTSAIVNGLYVQVCDSNPTRPTPCPDGSIVSVWVQVPYETGFIHVVECVPQP